MVISGYLIYFGTGFTRLGGVIFAALLPFAVYSGRSGAPEALKPSLSANQREQIHAYAAATWRYYEEYCTAEEHYLPPDNLQESPVWWVAHRTSPTNIGLYLLCVAAAHDLGLIDEDEMLTRIENTFDTIDRLENGGQSSQLVRHQNPAPSCSALCIFGRQRQLCMLSVALRQALAEIRGVRAAELAARAKGCRTRLTLSLCITKTAPFSISGLTPIRASSAPRIMTC